MIEKRTLRCRREALLSRSALQREYLATHLAPVALTLARTDRVAAGLRKVLRWALAGLPLYSYLRRA